MEQKIQAESTKNNKKMLQSLQFFVREESFFGLSLWKTQIRGRRKTNRSYVLQIMEQKHNNE